MKLLMFAVKNALRSWWRTAVFGALIFLISLISIFMGSFSFTIRNQMEDAIINGLSGHLQIRAGSSESDDFAQQLKSRWKGAAYLDSARLEAVKAVLRAHRLRHHHAACAPWRPFHIGQRQEHLTDHRAGSGWRELPGRPDSCAGEDARPAAQP